VSPRCRRAITHPFELVLTIRVTGSYYLPSNGLPVPWAMTSPSQPTGFAAYFAAQPSTLIHGLTSPPRTDSPSDSKGDSASTGVSDSPAPWGYMPGAAMPEPIRKSVEGQKLPTVDLSAYNQKAWKLTHDPELLPKGSAARSKPKERRLAGQGVFTSVA
jgi:hypothetical protein